MASPQPSRNPFNEQNRNMYLAVLGLMCCAILAAGLYQRWLGDLSTTTNTMIGVSSALLMLILAFVGFSRKRAPQFSEGAVDMASAPAFAHKYTLAARAGLVLVPLIVAGGFWLAAQHREELEQKLVVLLTRIDGPAEVTDLQESVNRYLKNEFSDSDSIHLMTDFEEIPTGEGSSTARSLGTLRLADIVIWGGYIYTRDPDFYYAVENLSVVRGALSLKDQPATAQDDGKPAELESFRFQMNSVENNQALSPLLGGYVAYRDGKYDTAIQYFDLALNNLSDTLRLPANLALIHFLKGNAHVLLGDDEAALQDYDAAVQTGEPDRLTYFNRAAVYRRLGKTAEADADLALYEELGGTAAP